MAGLDDETIGILGHFIGFWLFVFHGPFRRLWLQEFKKAPWFFKVFKIAAALWSVFIGLAVPALLLWWILGD